MIKFSLFWKDSHDQWKETAYTWVIWRTCGHRDRIHTRCLCHLPSTSLHHTSSLPLTVRPVWKQSESRRAQQLILTDLVRAVVSGEGASCLLNAVAGTHQQQRGQKGEPNVSEGVRKSDPIPTDENYPPVKGFLVQHVDWILQHLQNTFKHTSLSTSANSSTSK